MSEKHMAILSKSALFAGIGQAELESMLGCLKPKISSFNKNEYITVEGDKFENIGIILKGGAVVSKENAAGNRVVIAFLKPGDMFGEMIVFSDKSGWPATVQANEACEVFFLAKGKIIGQCEKICPWHRMLIQNMLKIMSGRALMLNKQVEYLTIKSMRGKISTFLLEQYKMAGSASFILQMQRSELADFLNVSRPSMSREMCRMRDEGIIDFHLSAIKIKDPEALKNALKS